MVNLIIDLSKDSNGEKCGPDKKGQNIENLKINVAKELESLVKIKTILEQLPLDSPVARAFTGCCGMAMDNLLSPGRETSYLEKWIDAISGELK